MGRGEHNRIIIGNLRYTVEEGALTEELGKVGPIKCLYIPRGTDGQSKGLAIVDLPDNESANHLYECLHGTVLFGRRCYLQFDDEPSKFVMDRSRRPQPSRGRSPPRARHGRSDDSDSDPPRDCDRRRYRDDDDRGRYRDERRWERSRDDRDRDRDRYRDSDDGGRWDSPPRARGKRGLMTLAD
jgi:RNA recognition motif-containing protein